MSNWGSNCQQEVYADPLYTEQMLTTITIQRTRTLWSTQMFTIAAADIMRMVALPQQLMGSASGSSQSGIATAAAAARPLRS
jgi:hypothetical protein